MVGVPGRSQACNTCRKRKKGKCDLKRPFCSRCQKAGIECAGYGRQLIFVNSTVQNKPVAKITLPDSLANSAYENKYVGLFWDEYLPGSRSLSANAVKSTLGWWTNSIPDLYQKNDTLKRVFLAVSMGTVGSRDGKRWMVEEGLRNYVAALHDMSSKLSLPSNAQDDTLYTATKLLSFYESTCGAGNRDRVAHAKAWVAHCNGETIVMAARQPEAYISGHSHFLFTDGRLNLGAMALLERRKSILSLENWKTIPWTIHKKTARDKLIDIYVDIPTLLEEVDAMKGITNPKTKEAKRNNITEHCLLLEKELAEWYARLPAPKEDGLPDVDNLDSLTAEDLYLTHLMTWYWATCLLLAIDVPDVAGPDRVNPNFCCRSIIRAMPIFLHPSVGISRMHLMTVPLTVAVQYMAMCARSELSAETVILAQYFKRPEAASIAQFIATIQVRTNRAESPISWALPLLTKPPSHVDGCQ